MSSENTKKELNELSKGKLAQYIKTAVAGGEKKTPDKNNNDEWSDFSHRGVVHLGHDLGKKETEREEVSRIFNRNVRSRSSSKEARDALEKHLGATHEDSEKVRHKVLKRFKGISMAADKLAREDVEIEVDQEQIDEISKKTLGSYIKRAQNDVDNRKNSIDRMSSAIDQTREVMHKAHDSFSHNKDYLSQRDKLYDVIGSIDKSRRKQEDKIDQRKYYKNKALKKLTKEEEEMSKKETIEETINNSTVSSGSEAEATLKPGAKSVDQPKSKLEYMLATLGYIGTLPAEDLSQWFNDSIGQIGHEADSIPAGTAEKNKATVSTYKGTVKESLDNVFGADQTLTEESKETLSTLFEAAVAGEVAIAEARIQEELVEAYEADFEELVEEITESLDTFLDEAASRWLDENQEAVENHVRNDICENFIEGMKKLFAESYIDIPTEKLDVVEELSRRMEDIEAHLATAIVENRNLVAIIENSEIEKVIDRVTDGMTELEASKFATLAESVQYDGDVETFEKKLTTIAENMVRGKKTSAKTLFNEDTGIVEDEPQQILAESETPTGMEAVLSFISKTARK